MLKLILLGLLGILVLVVAPVGYFGYQFARSGDDYGDKAQAVELASLRTTNQGDVVGFKDITGSHTWMGIPYAAPPVGDLRWQAPRPPASRKDTLQAVRASHKCKQIGSFGESRPAAEIDKPIGSEDCLYLNIFAPEMSKNELPNGPERLPVMVYIHGGGNTAGYANQFKYSGRNLASKHKVIVVNLNYRLGLFGWFAHPALNQNGSLKDKSGNYGILDILAALQWVQENIKAFGGDPGNVTLFGESAGGMNIFAILASPEARNLFHKVIIQSGFPVSMSMQLAQNYLEEGGHVNSAREVTNQLLVADATVASRSAAIDYQNRLGDAEIARYLRTKQADQILAVLGTEAQFNIPPLIFRDGAVVPKAPLKVVFSDAENYRHVPMIIGTNRDEFKAFFVGDPTLVEMQMGFLPTIIDPARFHATARYFNDKWKAVGVDEAAMRFTTAQREAVFAYRFDWDELPTVLGVDLENLLGAPHAFEIPFVFESFDDRFMNRVLFSNDNIPSRTVLSEAMSSYWTEFAYHGSPGKGRDGVLQEWQRWSEQPRESKFMILDGDVDGGLRMHNKAITLAVLKQRLMADLSFSESGEKSSLYDCLFRGSELWDDEQFKMLGGKACHWPVFQYLQI
jgi:para-nitrobenzyl esterase